MSCRVSKGFLGTTVRCAIGTGAASRAAAVAQTRAHEQAGTCWEQ